MANPRPIHFREESMSKRTQDLSHEVTYAGQKDTNSTPDTMYGHKIAKRYSTKFLNRMHRRRT
jgi:nitric oxide synthase oxygenase domain/subunit